MMAVVTLAAFAGGWTQGRLAPPPAPTPHVVDAARVEAGVAADQALAQAETATVAAIAAADPPYLVRLHVAPGVAPVDLARMVTAVRAWGFAPPQVEPAKEPVDLPEVRFHDEADREAARALGAVVVRLLGESVLTPPQPQAGAGLDKALASLGAPAEGASSAPAAGLAGAAAAGAPPAAAAALRVIDLFLPAR